MQAAKRPRTEGTSAVQAAPVRVLVTGGSGLVGHAIQTVIEAEGLEGGRAASEEWIFATRCGCLPSQAPQLMLLLN